MSPVRFAPMLLALSLGLAVVPSVAQPGGAVLPHENLNAVLWTQSAAEYRAVAHQAFQLATSRLDEALASPEWTAADEQKGDYGKLPPAVIVDVDETILDNSYYEARLVHADAQHTSAAWNAWVKSMRATPVPGAAAFCQQCRQKRVTVFYVTNRRDPLREATRKNLRALGFPVEAEPETVLTRSDTGDKGPRRARVAKDYRVLLMIGDNLNDFSSRFGKETTAERSQAVKASRQRLGTHWILLPNPMYGAWEQAALGASRKKSHAEQLAAKRAALRPHPDAKPGETPPAAATPRRPRGHPLLSSGPMLGHSHMTETVIWVQTHQEVNLQVRFWPRGTLEAARVSPVERARRGRDHIVTFRLTALEPGTNYDYELYLGGRRVILDHPLRFQTQAQWQHRTEPPAFTFLFGSCAYINETRFDRPGKPYGAADGFSDEVFTAMHRERPAFMVWLGDNVYYREPDWLTEAGMRHRYRHDRRLPAMQPLLASTHHYAIWDDHDFGPNNSDRSFRLKEATLRVFRDYWPAPTYGTADTPGCFHRFEWGDVEFFMLDDRYHRSPNRAPKDAGKVMLGKRQLQWLKDGLLGSRAPFKFVANGGQMMTPLNFYEGYHLFPHERAELVAFIVEHKIKGVVFLSGDRHHTELLRVTPEGGYPLYDFTSSPLTAGTGRNAAEENNPARVPGTWVTDKRNYGRVRVLGPRGKRRLELSAHDGTGKQLWQHVIREAELAVP